MLNIKVCSVYTSVGMCQSSAKVHNSVCSLHRVEPAPGSPSVPLHTGTQCILTRSDYQHGVHTSRQCTLVDHAHQQGPPHRSSHGRNGGLPGGYPTIQPPLVSPVCFGHNKYFPPKLVTTILPWFLQGLVVSYAYGPMMMVVITMMMFPIERKSHVCLSMIDDLNTL